ncbi:MAG: PQQ-binding-like beta-propeller repeat protein [Saprospiraceae bacterium]|nr:PQQ-binding-like beta-propeller repeat protein [Saprospiraceae bacterium]
MVFSCYRTIKTDFFYLSFLLILGFSVSATSFTLCQGSWTAKMGTVGSFSSPRVADLNQDKVLDIILGAGREEFQACDSAVIALDGKTGALLWKVEAKDQIFGSAALKDINADGVLDPVIGGRSAELIAIDGAKGEVLWRFNPKVHADKDNQEHWFNFYNPQFINDQNKDGVDDILISNGGDVMAEPYDPDRPPGYLVVVSGKDGQLLARAPMPDGKETYMSITISPRKKGRDYDIVFGTGGETIGGNLYVGRLSAVMKGDLTAAKILESSKDKGYIGPAGKVDITGDGIDDIVVNAVNGRLVAFDGKQYKKLWEVVRPNSESYSSMAIGYFTPDATPDFFVSYAQGVWPKLDWSAQIMVNGKTGQVEFSDSLGFYQNTTPVVLDWNNDGQDEILMSVNFQEIKNVFQKFFYNMLVIIDFKTEDVLQIGDKFEGNNLSSTPWIGDLDADNNLDIIYCHGTNNRHTYTFDGIKIHRIKTTLPLYKKIIWGAYQGSYYDGIFHKE